MKGMIAPGKLADLAILSLDILTVLSVAVSKPAGQVRASRSLLLSH
jgi:hypothetical protein